MDDLKLLAGAVLLYAARTWGRGIIGVITPPWFHKQVRCPECGDTKITLFNYGALAVCSTGHKWPSGIQPVDVFRPRPLWRRLIGA